MKFVIIYIKSFILEQALPPLIFYGIDLLEKTGWSSVGHSVECSTFCFELIASSRCLTFASIPCTFCKLVINLKPWLDSDSAVLGKDAQMRVVL